MTNEIANAPEIDALLAALEEKDPNEPGAIEAGRIRRRRTIESLKSLYLEQWRDGIFDGPAFFVEADLGGSKSGRLDLRSNRELCDPAVEPIAIWLSTEKSHHGARAMLIVRGTRYYLYGYAGEMLSIMHKVEIRIFTKFMVEVTDLVDNSL